MLPDRRLNGLKPAQCPLKLTTLGLIPAPKTSRIFGPELVMPRQVPNCPLSTDDTATLGSTICTQQRDNLSSNDAEPIGARPASHCLPPQHNLLASSSHSPPRSLTYRTSTACRLDVEPDLLNFPSRGRAPVCEARQISMYLARVCFCLSLTEVGQMFRRDRTTVAHACIVVEHRRDDVGFDLFLTKLELIARIMSGLPGPLHGVTTPAPRNARLNSPCRGVA
jgi:Bacterial dnaA protein helix-turn-helix